MYKCIRFVFQLQTFKTLVAADIVNIILSMHLLVHFVNGVNEYVLFFFLSSKNRQKSPIGSK